jgi:hypothetical protein
MDEELLRAWARDHSILVYSVLAAVVLLSSAIKIWWWIRKTDFPKAKAEFLEAIHADPAKGAVEAPLDRRTARIATFAFLILGLIVVALVAMLSWNEYRWIGAEVARARFVALTRDHGTLTAQYQVQPSTRPAFIATFSFTPRFDSWAYAADAMRNDRKVEIQSGHPLHYREYRRSSGRDVRGWSGIRFIAALGACFGGIFLFAAFKSHRAAITG